MPKAAIYARVSTPGQEREGTSLETQVKACLERAGELGLEVPPEYIVTEQASGADPDRPGLARVRELARSGRVDAVLVYHTDRLARDPVRLLAFVEDLKEAGVSVIFLEGPAGDSPEDKLIRFILGYVAERERALIAERTRRGKWERARQGRMPGGTGVGLYGYDYDPVRKQRTINPAEAEVVRTIFRLACQGLSAHLIARYLNERGIPSKTGKRWNPLTVRRLLRNPAYKGETYWGREENRRERGKQVRRLRDPSEWVLLPEFTPPIVDPATWEEAQKAFRGPHARSGKAVAYYMLAGMLRCATCGKPMTGSLLGRRRRYYRCIACKGPVYIQADRLEEAVWEEVKKALSNPEELLAHLRQQGEEALRPLREEEARIVRELEAVRRQEARLAHLYLMGFSAEVVDAEARRLRSARGELEGALARVRGRIEAMAQTLEAGARAVELARHMQTRLDSLPPEMRREVLLALRMEIRARPGYVHISGVLPQPSGLSPQETNMGITTCT